MRPSGAGKSTLLNIIATIDKATAGEVVIGNQNLSMMNSDELAVFRREKLGFIFQDYNLLDTMTLRENIALPLVLSKEKPVVIMNKVTQIAADLGIEKILSKYPYEVSGGQRQRASAARASYCKRILFIKDGVIFSEINRGDTRKAFFDQILKVLAILGGDNRE